MKCPGCGVELSRSEAKSGCSLCDWTPQREERLKERLYQAQGRKTDAQIKAANDANPRIRYLKAFTAYLVEQYRDEAPRWASNPVVMRNIRGANHDVVSTGHQIAYGYECMDWFFEQGFSWRNKTYRWLFDMGAKGYLALYNLVIHEFAHVLQGERNGRWNGGQHTHVWANAVKELRALVPFEDTMEFVS